MFSFCCIMTVKGGIRKMKSKKIRSYCDRLIFLLGIASAVILLKFSNAPNYFNISILNKPHGDWNIFISILTSYIVTAGFYFIMNFIPDKIKAKPRKGDLAFVFFKAACPGNGSAGQWRCRGSRAGGGRRVCAAPGEWRWRGRSPGRPR